MSYTEINSKYISKTRKKHTCEWCGTKIDIGQEAWYRFYEFDGETRSTWMHPECERASDRAHQDPQTDLQDGWHPGDYHRGEWISKQDYRYPRRSTWDILRQLDEFDSLKAGDKVCLRIQPDIVRTIESTSDRIVFYKNPAFNPATIFRDDWVLDDWQKVEEV